MKYIGDSGRIGITDGELAAFAYRKEKYDLTARRYGFVSFDLNHQASSASACELSRESISLNKEYTSDNGVNVSLSCTDFNVYSSSDGYIVEKAKNVRRASGLSGALSDPELLAAASVCALLLCEAKELDGVCVCLSCVDTTTGEKESYAAPLNRDLLTRMVEVLKKRISPFLSVFAEQNTVFLDEADRLPFPYRSIREGQVELIQTAFDTMKHGGVLLASAPTGIGKTISLLYTAVRTLGKKLARKIFYFTAKTVGGNSAVDATRRISKYAPHMRTVTICSKEQMCSEKVRSMNGGVTGHLNRCFACPLKDGIPSETGFLSYRERECAALNELLSSEDRTYTPEAIRECARIHSVCPHELSLDVSEYCALIICDYNYIINTDIRLKRYFANPEFSGNCIFLFDEAHNLPDRIRSTYSSHITSADVDALRDFAARNYPDDRALADMIADCGSTLAAIAAECTEGVFTDKNGHSFGFFRSDELYGDFAVKVSNLSRYLTKLIRYGVQEADNLENIRKPFAESAFASAYFDSGYRLFAMRENDSVSVDILCIDPSDIFGEIAELSSASVFFSATLAPMDYYSTVTGFRDAETLELRSPYPKDNLCVISYDSISTRLTDRGSTLNDIAEVIAATVSAKAGKYIAYFPSYEYLLGVFTRFGKLNCKCGVVIQKQNMSMKEKRRFIDVFEKDTDGTVVGFCVLGGMFAEGIDLSGKSLIGSIIIGTGIPMLSSERNIMAEYYSSRAEEGDGFDYAYTYPGICKVIQAGGRVIRSETDVGVVVLVDDRYRDPKLKKQLPEHWRHMTYTENLLSLSGILREFWDSRDG